ncbi:MAG: hypothetical protein QF896_08315, partial [Acidimicrobiales bacterium]|nr:hypothetical protein [Acidimicrobiales bacterium]
RCSPTVETSTGAAGGAVAGGAAVVAAAAGAAVVAAAAGAAVVAAGAAASSSLSEPQAAAISANVSATTSTFEDLLIAGFPSSIRAVSV